MINPQIISNETMASLEEAASYFKQLLKDHLDKKRDVTLLAVAVVNGRLKIVEGIPK